MVDQADNSAGDAPSRRTAAAMPSDAVARIVSHLIESRPDADADTARAWISTACRSAAEIDAGAELFERWKTTTQPPAEVRIA